MENDFSLQLNKALCQGWLKLSNCIWKRRRNCEYVITMTWPGVFYLWQSRIGIVLKILDRSINFWIKYMLPSFSYVHEARSDYGLSQTLFVMQHAASGDITRQNFRATSGLIFWYVTIEVMWCMHNNLPFRSYQSTKLHSIERTYDFVFR